MSGSLCDLVDELADDLVALLQRLIRIPTVNPPGEGYEEFVADLKRVLDDYGYATEVHYAPTELAPLGQGLPRPNLIAKLEGDGPLVHLNGHYDVVPVGNDWTRDPFGGELVDGKIYGRGAADMKSGLAAQIIAVEALRRAGLKPNVHQSAVPDEETVGVRNAGMGWLVEQGLLEGDAVIITEPFGPDGVGIGHKGAIWGEITIFGKQAHGSAPQLGVNAVEAMARYLAHIETTSGRSSNSASPTTASRPTTRARRCRSTRSAAATPRTSSPTAARSRSIAAWSRARTSTTRAASCSSRCRTCATSTTRSTPPSRRSSPRTSRSCRPPSARSSQLGLDPKILISAGSDDQRFVVHNAGITNSLVYGPGQTPLSHIADEYIAVDDLVLGTKGLALIIADLLESA